MKHFFKHSHFESNPFLHGGNKRTAQINELLSRTNIDFKEADFSMYSPSSKNISMLLKGMFYTKRPFSLLKNSYATGRYLKQFENFIKCEKPYLFIWESTSNYNLLLSKVLNENGIPFFAIPHNIESLVEGNKSPFSSLDSPKWLFEELNCLALSDNIFTISKEEQWLLSVNKIESNYLPYYPTELLKSSLLQIREQKSNQNFNIKKLNILLLGTFYNKPTFDGFVELIEHLKKYDNLTINVCGFGSEQLKGKYTENNVKIMGSLKNNELDDIIIKSDFGIIHQRPSSGALTRIPELLIAGLPLFVNIHAARSSPSNEGLQIYNSIPELLDLINGFTKIIPPILDRPTEEIIFINHILKFINPKNTI
ncbi:MAG: hypothetical protein EOO90_19010 [Pedobacter sp.]|nr:MAG: hypothetical protein EOO90_19010 [Pedobacter sp.]